MRLASSTSCSAVSSAVLPMVFRYTRTRSVDTRPLVSGSRRGERTSSASLGEDCSSVTMDLRPCLRFGCIRCVVGGGCGHPGVEYGWLPGSPDRSLALLSAVVRPAQRPARAFVFHERPVHSKPTGSVFGHPPIPGRAAVTHPEIAAM